MDFRRLADQFRGRIREVSPEVEAVANYIEAGQVLEDVKSSAEMEPEPQRRVLIIDGASWTSELIGHSDLLSRERHDFNKDKIFVRLPSFDKEEQDVDDVICDFVDDMVLRFNSPEDY